MPSDPPPAAAPEMKELIAKLRDLRAKATPGPWAIEHSEIGTRPDTRLVSFVMGRDETYVVVDEEPDGLADEPSPNAAFIVGMENAFDALLSTAAECARLRQDNQRLQDNDAASFERWGKALGFGLTAYQPENWALMDDAVNELVQLREDCARLTNLAIGISQKVFEAAQAGIEAAALYMESKADVAAGHCNDPLEAEWRAIANEIRKMGKGREPYEVAATNDDHATYWRKAYYELIAEGSERPSQEEFDKWIDAAYPRLKSSDEFSLSDMLMAFRAGWGRDILSRIAARSNEQRNAAWAAFQHGREG